MKDYILQRKIARIIAIIAERRGIPQSQALAEFYQSRVCQILHDPKTEMHLMSDEYVADALFINYEIKSDGTAHLTGRLNIENVDKCGVIYFDSKDGVFTIPESIFDETTEKSFPVVSIGPNIFKFRRELKALYLPKTIKEINTDFYNCPNFEQFVVDKDNKSLTSINGVLFSKDKKRLIYHPSALREDYYIPEGTEELDNCSFKCNYNLKNIWCPKSLKKIGINAFCDCPQLENVYNIPVSFKVFMPESRQTNFKVTTAKFHVGEDIYSLAEMTEMFPQD